MVFQETRLKGAFLVETDVVEDERGHFSRVWCRREFEAHGLQSRLAQANHSYNRTRGILRGLHYQEAPHAQAKVVHCFAGAIYDVIVDLRPSSPTYLQWIAVELAGGAGRMLYVPEGFAHGFQTLTDDCHVFYHMAGFYTPEAERGVRWDDPAFDIDWPPAERRLMSQKDTSWPAFTAVRPGS